MADSNPYTAPSARLEPDHGQGRYRLTAPKSLPAGRGWAWIVDGFGYFKRNPGAWILTLVVGLVIMIALNFVPIIGQLALMATTYVWMGGIMLGCHAQDRGRDFHVQYLFAAFGKPAQLILMSVISASLSSLIMIVAVGPLYLELVSGGSEPSPELVEAMMDPARILLPLLFGMLVMIPVMMALWFAPVLHVVNDVPLLDAMKLSFVGCIRNVLPFLIYGLAAFGLYIVAVIPLFLGLLILLPTLAASIYVSYKDIFIERMD